MADDGPVVLDEGGVSVGTGRVLALAGVLLCFVSVLLLFIHYVNMPGSVFGYLAFSMLLMLLGCLFVGFAVIQSMFVPKWLVVGYAWCALVVLMLVGGTTTLKACEVIRNARNTLIAQGLDFFVLAGAALIGLGAYMAQERIGLGRKKEGKAAGSR